MKVLLVFLAVAFLFNAKPSNAGIFVCNDSGVTLWVAVGYLDHDDDLWKAKGWWKIKPTECTNPPPVSGPIYNRYAYFVATGGGLQFLGNDDNGGLFCHDSAHKFTLINNGNCREQVRYRKIDVGSGGSIYRTHTVRLYEIRVSPLVAAQQCSGKIEDSENAFVDCWMHSVATVKQREILDCARHTESHAALALCASQGYLGDNEQLAATCTEKFAADQRHVVQPFVECLSSGVLSQQDQLLISCAFKNKDSIVNVGMCAGVAQLTGSERQLVECVARNTDSYQRTASCIISGRMSSEEAKLADCVINNRGSYVQMGVCAFGPQLTAEQQAFLECAITSGGQPVAYAGCVGTRLTVNELQKCMTDGIGGDGCFGKNNTVVKFTSNAWSDVTAGPGPSNDIVGRDGALMTAARDAEEAARRATQEATEAARRAARDADRERLRIQAEAEKSAQKLIDNPIEATGDFFGQLMCGFC